MELNINIKRLKIFTLILFLPFHTSTACELTKEYKEAHIYIYKSARHGYDACLKSVSDYCYWKEVSKCKDEGRGKNISGGCQHVAGYSMPKIQGSEFKHCEILKSTKVEVQKGLEEYVKTKGITKCRDHSVESIPLKGTN